MRLRRNLSHVLPLLLTAACGSEGGASPWDLDPTGGGNGLGDLDGGALGDGSAYEGDDANPPSWNVSQPGSGGPLTEENACAASAVEAEQIVVTEEVEVEVEVEVPAPVTLYVMFDRSWSMDGYNGAPKVWVPATDALKAFVNDPNSDGMGIALQYFPKSGGACNGNGYKTPAVAFGRLPARADAIEKSLDDEDPDGLSTPIEGALRGVTEYCKGFQAEPARNGERCVAVLVTDGEANGCNESTEDLVEIAADAWNLHQVRTFAVGLKGANFDLLDKIAKQGGAADCDPGSSRFSCDLSQSGPEKLAEALAKIRDTVTTTETRTETQTRTEHRPLECEWQMPEPKAGEPLDPGQVNVTVSGGNGGALDLGRVPNAASCSEGAWHYDDPAAPQRIIACPETCDAIKAAGHTDVKILLGCETRVLIF